jgi:hypothetical protein
LQTTDPNIRPIRISSHEGVDSRPEIPDSNATKENKRWLRAEFLTPPQELWGASSSARSYGQIMGSNERLNFAVIGLNSRAYAHL